MIFTVRDYSDFKSVVPVLLRKVDVVYYCVSFASPVATLGGSAAAPGFFPYGTGNGGELILAIDLTAGRAVQYLAPPTTVSSATITSDFPGAVSLNSSMEVGLHTPLVR